MIVVNGAIGQYGPLVIENLLRLGAEDEITAAVRDSRKVAPF